MAHCEKLRKPKHQQYTFAFHHFITSLTQIEKYRTVSF